MNIQELKQAQDQLFNELGKDANAVDATLEAIKAIESQITNIKVVEMLRKINGKYNAIRDSARAVYAAFWVQGERPTEDIITSSGEWHKVKAKKYPTLTAIPYGYGTWNSKENTLESINVNGEKFQLYVSEYVSGKTTWRAPKDFAEFLKMNNVPQSEISIDEYNQLIRNVEANNKRLKDAIENHSAMEKCLRSYSYSCWGVLKQSTEHLHPYVPVRP